MIQQCLANSIMRLSTVGIVMKPILTPLCLTLGLAAAHAATSRLQPLIQTGQWPAFPRGEVFDVTVAGRYAYLSLGWDGLLIVDISNPTNGVQVGGYRKGVVSSAAVSGN